MAMISLSRCPLCGCRAIRRVRRRLAGQIRGRRYTTPAVSFYACPGCGEEFYDHDAMLKIEATRRVLLTRRTQAPLRRRARTPM